MLTDSIDDLLADFQTTIYTLRGREKYNSFSFFKKKKNKDLNYYKREILRYGNFKRKRVLLTNLRIGKFKGSPT